MVGSDVGGDGGEGEVGKELSDLGVSAVKFMVSEGEEGEVEEV